MTERITVPKSDFGYTLTFNVVNASGTAENLTPSTVTFKMWSPLTPATLIISATCALSTTVTGEASYTVGTTDFQTAGNYLGEIELTRTGVRESTEPIQIIVRENG